MMQTVPTKNHAVGRKAVSFLNFIYPPILLIGLLLVIWQSMCTINDVPMWMLAKPTDIASVFFQNTQELLPHIGVTYFNIIVGFLLSVIIGIGLAILISSFPTFGSAVTPIIVALCCVPVITLVPMLMLVFGLGSHYYDCHSGIPTCEYECGDGLPQCGSYETGTDEVLEGFQSTTIPVLYFKGCSARRLYRYQAGSNHVYAGWCHRRNDWRQQWNWCENQLLYGILENTRSTFLHSLYCFPGRSSLWRCLPAGETACKGNQIILHHLSSNQ